MLKVGALVFEGLKHVFSIGCIRVWQRDFDVWRKKYAASLTGNLGEPILFLFAMGFGMGSLIAPIEGASYIEFIAPGLIGSAVMYAASFECTFGSYTRIAVQKTFDAIRVTPISLEEVTAGDILWGATKGMMAGMAFIIVMLLFGLIKSPWACLLPALMVIEAVGFASLAMLCSSKAPSYDFFSYYFTLVLAPMFLFSGIFFPLNTLPAWVQTIAWFTPLNHFIILSRALVLGDVTAGLLIDFIWLLMFTTITLSIAIRGVRQRVMS